MSLVNRQRTRRAFLKGGLVILAGSALAACSGPSAPASTPASSAGAAATSAPASQPTTAATSSGAAPAASAAPSSGGKVSLTFWNDIGATNAKPYTDLQNLFDKQTGIKINQQVMKIGDLNSKLQLSAPAGQAPDMALLYTTSIPHFADMGTIQELDAKALEDTGIKESDYAKATWDGGTYKGKRYSVTQDVVQSALFVNNSMFKDAGLIDSDGKPKIPTDQASFEEAAKQLTKNGVYGGLFGGGTDYNNFEELLWQNGSNVFSDDLTKSILDQQPAIDVAKFWASLYTTLKVSPPDGVDANKAFVAKKLAMWVSGSWNVSGFDAAKVEYTVAHVPKIFKTAKVWSLGHELTMPIQKTKNADKVAGVWKFVKFMIDNGATWTVEGGVLAANNSVYDDPRIAKVPALKVFTDQAKDWGVGQSTPVWPDAEALIGPAIDAIYLGQKKPDEAMKALATQVTGLLS